MYLVRDIPAFVMYCVNGEYGSSLLIESIDSMIVEVMQGCHKLGFYPSSRIFNTCQSYLDGFVEIFGFFSTRRRRKPSPAYARICVYVRIAE